LRPIYDANITARAKAAKEALAALDGPEKALEALDEEITAVRAKCSSLAEGTYGGDVAGRVRSRQEFAAWETELGLLEQRRDELAQEAGQLRLEADKARSRAEDVIGGKAMLESAILARSRASWASGQRATPSSGCPRRGG
jgi:hypothetical protein